MKLRFREEVSADLNEAAYYYEQRQRGLGRAFLAAATDTLSRMKESPRAFPLKSERVRLARMERFPFGIFFSIREDTMVVLAVMHLARHPRHWERRQQS